ncbi:hypothetical protein OGATHE_006740 [Ogataea polymorpha]|uniref:Uncharacterized protein n=1 Tax=Ogataea polymorpha TaxID=460523 RepID=A0A9P8SYD9_9ASCO|nr:hypothetical protein OGATHE_006740 [Ogataea polymorpha]
MDPCNFAMEKPALLSRHSTRSSIDVNCEKTMLLTVCLSERDLYNSSIRASILVEDFHSPPMSIRFTIEPFSTTSWFISSAGASRSILSPMWHTGHSRRLSSPLNDSTYSVIQIRQNLW